MGQLCSRCCNQEDEALAEDGVKLEGRRKIKSRIYAPQPTTERTWDEDLQTVVEEEGEEHELGETDNRPVTVYEPCWQTESYRQEKALSFVPLPKSVEPAFMRAKVKPLDTTVESDEPIIRKEEERRLTNVPIQEEEEKYMSSELISTLAMDLFEIEGVTFCGANEQGGITVLVLKEYVEVSTPLIKGIVASQCSRECIVEVGTEFCYHANTIQAGDPIGGRTVGFVGISDGQPVILTAAHFLENDLSVQVTQDFKKLFGYKFYMKYLTFRDQRIATRHGPEISSGIGVISTCVKWSDDADVGKDGTNGNQDPGRKSKDQSTPEGVKREEAKRQNLFLPASDMAVFALDDFETIGHKAVAETAPGLPTTLEDVSHFLEIVHDPTSLFGVQLWKTGAVSGVSEGEVKQVNGVLKCGKGVFYRNVIRVSPIGVSSRGGYTSFSKMGDSGAGVLTGPNSERPSAVGFVLGGEEGQPFGYCTLLKDNLEVLRQHPNPTINGRCVKDIQIVHGGALID